MAAKRSRQEAALVASAAATATPRMPTTSKFFHGPQRSVSDPRGGRGWSRTVALATAGSPASQPQQPVAGSSGLLRCEKENVPCQEDARPEAVAGEEDVDLDVCMREPDAVVQEDGYVSPTESIAQWDSPDLSSPLRPGASKRRRSDGGGGDDWDEIDDADVLSSSPVAHTRTRKLPTLERERFVTVPRALPLRPVVNTNFSSRARRKSLGSKHGAVDDSINSADGSEDEAGRGPDLQNVFDDCDWDEITSGGEDDEDCEIEDKDVIDRTASSTPRPITLATEDGERCLLEESNSEELMASAAAAAAEAARNATVANGWWEKWARSGASTSAGGNRNHSDHDRIRVRHAAPALALAPLRRRETTMTPDGPRRPPRDPQRPNSAPQASKRKGFAQEDLRATGRRGSLIFTKTEDVKVTPKAGGKLRAGASSGGPGPRTSASSSSGPGSRAGHGSGSRQKEPQAQVAAELTRNRLEQFRWTPACR
ncbi:hypothetical protein L226DRAFT_539789 [Lentinus tigrinus ALCF2SS1-7]|uniref:uncharacterized protein n=1 Tax=Lentinus tigrinus ALCF2SS1-7 TaxID=1328758 RepID=UPI001165DD6C|nr:hypothetical protein L226DRAFT_539789 [Lentinus tigrinus ALCF2SS1-7]